MSETRFVGFFDFDEWFGQPLTPFPYIDKWAKRDWKLAYSYVVYPAEVIYGRQFGATGRG